MKVKVVDLGTLGAAVNQIIEFDIETKRNWVVWAWEVMCKTINEFVSHFNAINEEIKTRALQIMEKHGAEDVNGQLVVPKVNKEAYEKEYNEYLETEVEIPWVSKSYDEKLVPIKLMSALKVVFGA